MTAARTLFPASYHSSTILLATPNGALRKQLADVLRKSTTVSEAATGAEALSRLERDGARIVVLDRNFPDLNCEELIDVIERQFPSTEVVLLNELGAIEIPDEMRDETAYRWFQDLPIAQETAEAPLPTPTAAAEAVPMPLPNIVGQSELMLELSSMVRAVAPHATSVLVTGETGTGKELVAEAIHQLSPRADKPFITVNCAAIPEALVESELFGHTRGAFTGAVQSRLGKIHAAQGGTIFFDEIGELPLVSQSKLLRFLECGEVQRLGTSDVFRMDARVVAATNVDLEERVARGLFREDLYYRLSVFPVELPPLRQRKCDVPLLARHFLRRLTGGAEVALTNGSEARLTAHDWPGNVRELRNVMERAFVLSGGRMTVAPEHIRLRKPCASVRPSEIS